MFRTSVFALAAIAALSTPAAAGGVTVRYNPAQLEDPAKVEALYAEIEAAALKVCRQDLLSSDFGRYRLKDCVEYSISRAVQDVGSPALSAYVAMAPAPRAYAAADAVD